MEGPPFRLKKSLGQHFLQDESVIALEAKLLSCGGSSALEIGAGDGRLSEKVLAENPSSLTLLEIDAGFIRLLKQRFARRKEVAIVHCDALDYLKAHHDGRPFFGRVIGNIPYRISGPLFASLSKKNFKKGIFCVQEEVAQRLAASPGTHGWGRLSVTVQLRFSVKRLIGVPRAKFSPPPKVDSAIVEFDALPRSAVPRLPQNFDAILAALSSHRLQTVGNALYHARSSLGMGKEEARMVAKTIKYSDERVFSLPPQKWAELSWEISEKTA